MAQVTVDIAYDGQFTLGDNNKNATGTVINIQRISASNFNVLFGRFDFTGGLVTGPIALTQAQLRANVTVEDIEVDDAILVRGYNSDGQTNPEPDTGATMNGRLTSGSVLDSFTTPFQTTGVKTVTLGAAALAQIQAVLDANIDFWAISIAPNFNTNFEVCQVEAVENAGASPLALILDYEIVAFGIAPVRRRREGY